MPTQPFVSLPATSHLGRGESAERQQRLDARVSADGMPVDLRRSAVPPRDSTISRKRRSPRATSRRESEPVVRVVIQHFGPKIRVVAGAIAAAPRVREVLSNGSAGESGTARPCSRDAALERVDALRRSVRGAEDATLRRGAAETYR